MEYSKGVRQARVHTVLCFLLPGHAPWLDLGPFPWFGIITSDMKIRGGGVKRVKKIANVDEVEVPA